jgi:hypothetical protein
LLAQPANANVAVNLENGTQATIFHGHAVLTDDEALMNRLDDVYEVKYKIRHGPPIWQLVPEYVIAWNDMGSVTKFVWV